LYIRVIGKLVDWSTHPWQEMVRGRRAHKFDNVTMVTTPNQNTLQVRFCVYMTVAYSSTRVVYIHYIHSMQVDHLLLL